jgi:hypothetical protein
MHDVRLFTLPVPTVPEKDDEQDGDLDGNKKISKKGRNAEGMLQPLEAAEVRKEYKKATGENTHALPRKLF